MIEKPKPAPVVVPPVQRAVVERLLSFPADPLLCDDYSTAMLDAAAEINRLNAQRRELQAERERLLDSLARAGLEASRMVRQERHEIAQWLDGQGQPGYAHEVRCRA